MVSEQSYVKYYFASLSLEYQVTNQKSFAASNLCKSFRAYQFRKTLALLNLPKHQSASHGARAYYVA